jgi:hypothetical protein
MPPVNQMQQSQITRVAFAEVTSLTLLLAPDLELWLATLAGWCPLRHLLGTAIVPLLGMPDARWQPLAATVACQRCTLCLATRWSSLSLAAGAR